MISKCKIANAKQAWQIMREKTIMQTLTSVKCRFVPNIIGTHQSETELVLKMEILGGCPLNTVMFKLKKYYQFYIAEIICFLKELHDLKIVYRDLKPEHVLICSDGHCKVVDYGFSK